MATMNVSIPDSMKDWVQSCVDTGSYANSSDYIRDLIRRDQEYRVKLKNLQAAIDLGLASGVSERSLDDLLSDARE